MLLKNKVAIITGGSRGVGKAIVREFSRNGAQVVFNYLKSENEAIKLKKEIEANGRDVLIYKQDVKDFDGMKVMIEDIKKKFGKIDIIVNNAGILKDKALMLMSEEDWNDVIETNLSGVFNLTRAAIVTMLKQKEGIIINIASVSGITGMARQVNYSASKAGMIGFTKALAKEVGSYGIRVNAIAPGYTDTDMIVGLKEDKKGEIFHSIPLGRFGKSEEVAKLAVFLASEKSQYITGQTISIDGGLVM